MSSVRLRIEDGVAAIRLDRPDRLNALDVASAVQLAACAERAAASDADVVVVTGSGRAFCAGGDVAEMAEADDRGAYMRRLVGEANRAMRALRAIPQPLVARVNGAVAGAGLGIVLTTDVAVAAETATFTPAYGAIGLPPDCGATALLAGAVGERRARDYLLTGRRIDAATALAWGLVARTAPAGDLDDAVGETIAAVRAAGPAARTTKALLGARTPYDEALESERDAIAAAAATDDVARRLEAFVRRG